MVRVEGIKDGKQARFDNYMSAPGLDVAVVETGSGASAVGCAPQDALMRQPSSNENRVLKSSILPWVRRPGSGSACVIEV